MNFKILASALVLMGTAASAQTADDLRIYINPGHGSWTGNDRPMQPIGHQPYTSTGTDSTSFFESNTDLIKGFGVLEKLIEMGFPFDRTLNQEGERWEIGAARDLDQNLVMSRVKNGPYHDVNDRNSEDWQYYNRDLTEICVEVEYNDFDQFISIHSNAAGSGGHNNVNYHLFMYRGYNGQKGEAVAGSYAMCEAASLYSFTNEHAQWSEDKVYINGETDFMGHGQGSTNKLGYYGYLGVMKHGVPGYLVEGFFHTYTPSMHRAMNFDVDLLEGYAYARGVAEWFELEERDKTGEIYGIVRDAHTSFSNELWIPRSGSDDVLMPINECKVILSQNGKVIKEYMTDKYYNGAFVFIGLEPGIYQVSFEHPGYMPGEPVDVEVKEGATVYPKVYLTDIYYNGRPGEEMNYVNPLPDSYTLDNSYDMYTAYEDLVFPQIEGYTIKRLIWNKNHAFILADHPASEPTVLVIDAHTGYLLRKLNLKTAEAAPGTILEFSDIQVTGQGDLIACSKSKNQYTDKYVQKGDERGTLTFYIWEKDADGIPTGEPKKWFETQSSGMWYRSYVGDTFAFRGNLDDGELIMSAVNTAKDAMVRTAAVDIVDNQPLRNSDGEVAFADGRPSKIAQTDYVDGDFHMVVSPNNRHQIYVLGNGEKFGIREYDFRHTNGASAISESPSALGSNTTSAGFFKFGNDVAMTMASPAGMKLYTIGRGLSAASEITLNGINLQGEAKQYFTTGYPIATTDDAGNVIAGDFSVLVLRDNKLSRYATSEAAGVDDITVDTDVNAPVYYYDLNGRRVNGTLGAGIYVRVQGTTATKVIVK